MKENLIKALQDVAGSQGIQDIPISLEYPENPEHGDFSTNIALVAAKQTRMSPKALAEKIVGEFDKTKPGFVESVSIAGPGFINIKIKDRMLAEAAIATHSGTKKSDRQVMVEYTDPNPFKVFHIGHLMSNAIGESLSRLIEYCGAHVIRANWQGDVGPHVAKAIWGAMHINKSKSDFASAAAFWGHCYVVGAKAYDEDDSAKKEIGEINKKIYDKSDDSVNLLYDTGRQQSLDAFEIIYKRLGTKFDNYFFEGIEGRNGEVVVRAHVADGIFAESEGAVVFKGEDHGLHTRVFITSQGLPTYETKELGLNAEKFKLYPDLDESIIITANEQNDYFKVLLKVMSLVMPAIGSKTKHMSHGMMRFASGKMSSRTGNVISAESLIDEVKAMVKEKMAGRELAAGEVEEISDIIAVAAIKYTVLRSSVGSDIVFDSVKSISFEGDSGPYLQYSAVRAKSVLKKADDQGIGNKDKGAMQKPEKVGLLERLISRFPDMVVRARADYAPQLLVTYLTELAGAFNGFYANNMIVDPNEPLSPYRIALTRSFLATMTDGLWLLGIKVPERM